MEGSDIVKLLKQKRAAYEAGRITLSSVISDIEYLVFDSGGEKLFSKISDLLSTIEDINAHSAQNNYAISTAESAKLKSLFDKLEAALSSA